MPVPGLPTGVSPEILVSHYPRLYHMAALGSWPSIRDHGLFSTSALLSFFNVEGVERRVIEDEHRPESVVIAYNGKTAVVRDQIPMSDADLRRCLTGGLAPRDWYRILNSKVFFWPNQARLETLLRARAYRERKHVVLTVDTASLVADYQAKVWLSPLNSGATKPMPFPRGPDTFQRLPTYPFAERRRLRGRANAIAEVAVDGVVTEIEKYVLEVRERTSASVGRIIWEA